MFHICDVAEMVVIHNTILAKFRDKQDNIKVERVKVPSHFWLYARTE